MEDGNYTFEVGFNLFRRNAKGGHYRELDEWWIVDVSDIVQKIPDPKVVEVTSKRFNYVWDDGF